MELSEQVKRLSESFYVACNKKDYAEMERLLAAGADVDIQNIRGVSPLMGACQTKNYELMDWLLAHGASPNVKTVTGDTPMHEVSKWEGTEHLKKMIAKGGSPDVQNFLGSTPLMEACSKVHLDSVAMMLKAGADANLKSSQGTSALLNACVRHNSTLVSLLLKEGKANPNDCDQYGVTTLIAASQLSTMMETRDKALEAESLACVKALLKAGANPNQRARSGNSALAEASSCLNRPVAMELLANGADANVHSGAGIRGELTVLMIAAAQHDPEWVKAAIKHGADVNYENSKGQNALQIILGNGVADDKDREKVLEIIELLHSKGAKSENGKSGLAHFAVISDAPSMAEKAASLGVLDQQDKEGHSALHVAIFLRKEKMLDKLLELRADANVQDKKGAAPLHVLAMNPIPQNLAQVIGLMKAQQDEAKRKDGERLEQELKDSWVSIMGKLVKAGAFVNLKDSDGNTPLSLALRAYASGGIDGKALDALVDAGAGIAERNEQGDSPFVLAIKIGDLDLVKKWTEKLIAGGQAAEIEGALMDVSWTAPEHPKAVAAMRPVFEYLIETGAKVNFQDEDGQSPLVVAAATNQDDLLELLLDLGADPNMKNNEGEVPAAQAIANNHPNITKVLLARGTDPEAVNNAGEDLMAIAYRYQSSTIINQITEAKQAKRASVKKGFGA